FAFIAAIGRPVKSYRQPDLWVMDIAPDAKPRNLTESFDFDVAAGLTGDSNAPIWTADGRGIIETYAKEGRSNLATFAATDGKFTTLTQGDHAVTGFRA